MTKPPVRYLRLAWLRDWLAKTHIPFLDVYNRDLVDDFIEQFGCRRSVMIFGADKCPALNRVLSWGYSVGHLRRHSVPLNQAEAGFPRWTYAYEFKDLAYRFWFESADEPERGKEGR